MGTSKSVGGGPANGAASARRVIAEQPPHPLSCGGLHRRLTELVHDVGRGPGKDKEFRGRKMPLPDGLVERSAAHVADRVDFGTSSEQHCDGYGITPTRCDMEWRVVREATTTHIQLIV